MTNSTSKTIRQWVALNGLLKTAKIVALSQAVVILFLAVVSLSLYFKDPLVVLTNGKDRVFKTTERKPQELLPQDIEGLVRKFLVLRYNWESFNHLEILEKIRPFVKEGFYRKLLKSFKKEKRSQIKDKEIRQVIADININIEKDAVYANFFKILIIEKIPVTVRTEVAIQLAGGAKSPINPFGIYINGIIEHNEKRK